MKKTTLGKKLNTMSILIILLSVLLLSIFSINTLSDFMDKTNREYSFALAKTISEIELVKSTLKNGIITHDLQSFIEGIRINTNAQFIVVMDMNSIRYTHSNPDLIGKVFTGGDEEKAKHGYSYISEAVGISGPSIRAFAPVYFEEIQVGVVSVGFFYSSIDKAFYELIYPILIASILSILIGTISTSIVTSHIKKEIFGLEPSEIAIALKERQTIIDFMKDGIISIDKYGNINVINNEAARILEIPDKSEVIGKPVISYIPNTRLIDIMNNRNEEYDQEQVINKSIIITNRIPIIIDNNVIGAMAFFKDKTELYDMARELTGVKEYTQALRANSHEYLNKLQTIVGLIELGEIEKSMDIIMSVSKIHQNQMNILITQLKFPELVGIILGKINIAKEQGIELTVAEDSRLYKLPPFLTMDNLITVIGNLLQNSIESMIGLQNDTKKISLGIYENSEISIIVKNNGPIIKSDIIERILEKGFTTKKNGHGIGLYLINNIINSAGGTLNISSDECSTKFIIKIPIEVKSCE